MIWFFISMVIGTIMTLWFIWDTFFPCPSFGDILTSFFVFLAGEFVSMICSFIITLAVGCLIGCFFEPVSYTQTETPLIALKDNSTINGSFFLGCGSVGSKTQYSYAVDTEFGIEIKTLSTDEKIYFKYDEGTPALITSEPVYSTLAEWISIPYDNPIYTFRIPEGSVINEYEIDLE